MASTLARIRRTAQYIFLFVFLGGIVGGIRILVGSDVDSFERIRSAIESFGVIAPAVFVVVYIVATIALLPGTPLTITAGVLFGPWLGTLYVLLGATSGAVITFFMSRLLGRRAVRALLRDRLKRIKKYDDWLNTHGFLAVLFLRLIPLFPYNVLNYALGVTHVSARNYILATALGMIPGTFVYVYFGSSLAALSPGRIAISIGIIAALVAGTTLWKRLRKPLMENEFDLIVIGAGAAGLNCASFMNRAGFKVLLIEKKALFVGGDCLNTGCVPSKALLRVAELVHNARQNTQFGVRPAGRVDFTKVREYIHSRQEIIRAHENADYLRQQGIHIVLGTAVFSGPRTVQVNGQEFIGRNIIIATGSKPRMLSVPGMAAATVHTHKTIFDSKALPERLLVVGAGPIGLELAQAFCRLGSQVTLVTSGSQLLEKEDSEIVAVLETRLVAEGVRIIKNSTLEAIPSSDHAEVLSEDGTTQDVPFDSILIAIGRELRHDNLALEKAGIKTENGTIVLDESLRTSNKHVYVCGDAAGQHQFTHATELHAALIVRNFFTPLRKKLTTGHMSWVTFTDPEVATFGLSEQQLTE
ncbi:MAG: FAD-dependent oxidoreductase, partial [Acidobacteriota bacterium]